VFGDYMRFIKGAHRDVLFFLGGGFLVGFAMTGFNLLFNLYMKEAGFGEGTIGSLLSAQVFTTALLTLPAAFVVRRFRIKLFLMLMPIIGGIGQAIVISGFVVPRMYAGMVVVGIASVFRSVIGGPLLMERTSAEARAHFFSLNFAVGLLSGITGNLVAGSLPHLFSRLGYDAVSGYRYAILIHLAVGAMSVLFYSRVKLRRIAEISNDNGFFHIHSSPWLIVMLIIPPLIVGLGAGLTVPFLNLYFRDRFSLSSRSIGALFATVQFAMVTGLLIAPWIAKRIGKIRTVMLSQLLSVPFLLVLGLSFSFPLSVVAFVARATLMNMAQPLITNFALEQVAPADRSLISGAMNVAWLSAWGMSANIGGRLIESYGYLLPFTITAICYVISTLLYGILYLPKES